MTTPDSAAPSALLRVQGSSRLAFGATTAALVTLASGGTALLVSHATSGISSPTALPPGAQPQPGAAGGLVVPRVAGTPAAQPAPDETVRALRDALAARPEPGRRTLTAPLVPSPAPTAAVQGPVAPPQVAEPAPPATAPAPSEPVLAPVRTPAVVAARHHGHAPTPKTAHSPRRPSGDEGGKHVRPPAHGKGRHAR